MAKMKAIEAAVKVLEKEGVSVTFGVPGAAINPLYAAMKEHGGIGHILARHVEGASHMAEGYTRAVAGNTKRPMVISSGNAQARAAVNCWPGWRSGRRRTERSAAQRLRKPASSPGGPRSRAA